MSRGITSIAGYFKSFPLRAAMLGKIADNCSNCSLFSKNFFAYHGCFDPQNAHSSEAKGISSPH
jgi:hypothetical protein